MELVVVKLIFNIILGFIMAFLIVVAVREFYLFSTDLIKFSIVKYIYPYIGKSKESKKAKKDYKFLKFEKLVINNFIKN